MRIDNRTCGCRPTSHRDWRLHPHANLTQLIEWTYPELEQTTKDADLDLFAHRCIVAPTNEAANDVNELILDTKVDACRGS